eukprot:TRINITY_DN9206_c0_g1_i13.p1 TRINITY_DN9206_c0_g1~~TRINITY_DN9206_c0_g1_i13.p1  ORF type:complete len:697 (+),score=179.72 TRINITY_DN9206_c0_g1_i13:113-2203(+)
MEHHDPTSRKELWPLLAEYQKLFQHTPSDAQLTELSKRISQFLETYTSKLASGASATRKAAFLLKFDSLMNAHGTAPVQKFYAQYGAILIAPFLKLSFYKESFSDYGEDLKGRLDYSNETTMKKLNELSVEDRVNRIIENIVEEIFESGGSKELLHSVCDWMVDEIKLTACIVRLIDVFSRILPTLTHERGKFLQSFLYIFGGIVKEETLNYLKAVLDAEEYRVVERYVGQEERKAVSALEKEEVKAFERRIPEAVTRFFAALLAPSTMKRALNSDNEEAFYKLISEINESEYEKEYAKNPEKANLIESAHYSYMFGFDTLAFYFCFLVKQSSKPLTEDKVQIKKILEESTPLKHPKLTCNYILPGSETLIRATFKMLLEICGDPLTIAKLCARRLKDGAKDNRSERAYSRAGGYNYVGAALYFYLVLAEQRRGERLLPEVLSNEYVFEVYLPFIEELFRIPMTAKFGIELLHMFLVEDGVDLKEYKLNSNSFIDKMRDLLETMAKSSEEVDETLQYMEHIMLTKLMESTPIKSLLLIVEKLIPALESDKARAAILQGLKNELLKVKDKETAQFAKSVIGEFFADHIDIKDLQLAMLESISTVNAFLELYKSLVEEGEGVYEVKSDKEFQETLNKHLVDPMNVVLKVILDEEEKEAETAEKKVPDKILSEYRKEKAKFEALRTVIKEIESALSTAK